MSAAKNSWPRVRLGDVCEEIHERIPSSSIAIDGYITTDNMLKNCAGVCVAEYVPKGVGLVRYQRNDVLMANIRPYLRKLWRADREGGCSSDVVVFRSATPDLSPEYLFAALSQDRFFDYVMQKPRGTKMPRGDREWMKNFEIPLPPFPVQREIVARLERELGAVDELAKKFAELETAAEAEFKATLKETFDEISHGGAETRRLGEVCEILDSRRKPIAKANRVPGTIPYYGATGVVDYINDWLFDERLVLLGEDGAKWGAGDPSAFIAEGRFWVNNHAHVLKPCQQLLDCYLVYYLNCTDLSDAISGVTVPKLNQQRMRDISLSLPPLPVQREIVARLDAAKARKDKLVAAAKRGACGAAVWRKAILKEAFE